MPTKKIYTDAIVATSIPTDQTVKTHVSAAVDEWRNSGVKVEKSNKYKISASGKWRTFGACHFTNPDGLGLYKAWCPNLTAYPAIIKSYSHSALIAKIGMHGQPFIIGNERILSASNSGILYFRINDAQGYTYDNEGEVIVTTQSVPSSQATSEEVITHAIAANQKVTTFVSAAIEDWKNSGVTAKTGHSYTLSASGKWKTYDLCNFTDPDGIGLYKAGCPNWSAYPPIVKNQSHSALAAKVGEQGQPFVVGNELQFRANNSGNLYFRINDASGYTGDNEGFISVNIQSAGATSNAMLTADSLAIDTIPSPQPSVDLPQKSDSDNSKLPLKIIQNLNPRHTALIIGNSDYIQSPLKNPVNDATAIAASLKSLGFDVATVLNANQQQMEQAIDQFGRKLLSNNHIALFYYAGHGVQVDGENYLIPIKATINRQSDVRYKAVNIGQILGIMGEASENLNIVILDACRNNPLPRSFRSSHKGLARVEGPKGTIIGFATSPGSVAADGEGDNGLYTHHLLTNMKIPGLSIEDVFKKVLQGVNRDSNGQQTPWTESSFTGDFSFIPK